MASRALSTVYSEAARAEIVEHVLEEIVKGERGLVRILSEDDGMPSTRTFYDWMIASEEISAKVERAREIAATAAIEETREIVESTPADKDEIALSKLRIYQREMFAKKIAPKRFGDKVDVTSNGKALPANVSDNRLQAIIGTVAQRKQAQIERKSDGDDNEEAA